MSVHIFRQYGDRTKVDGRSLSGFVLDHLEKHSESNGWSYEQREACREAMAWINPLIVPDIEIDSEQVGHFVNWLVAHVVKSGGMAPIDYIVFATYINTAAIRDPSIYM